MKCFRSGSIAAVLVLGGALALFGQTPQTHAKMVQPVAEAKWGPAPPMLPAGAEIAVLAGNPMAAEPYTVRLRFPANYSVPAHSHPTDENVTVVSGTFYMGMGDKLDRNAGQPLSAGGFAQAPAGMNHWAFTRGGPVTIVLYGIGPVEFKYVNPADDPRNGKVASK